MALPGLQMESAPTELTIRGRSAASDEVIISGGYSRRTRLPQCTEALIKQKTKKAAEATFFSSLQLNDPLLVWSQSISIIKVCKSWS